MNNAPKAVNARAPALRLLRGAALVAALVPVLCMGFFSASAALPIVNVTINPPAANSTLSGTVEVWISGSGLYYPYPQLWVKGLLHGIGGAYGFTITGTNPLPVNEYGNLPSMTIGTWDTTQCAGPDRRH